METLLLQLLGGGLMLLVVGLALTTTKDTGGIGMGGGNIVYAREVTSAGVDLGTPDTNHSLGHIDESGWNDVSTIVKRFNERGGQTFHGESQRDVTARFVMQQTDLAHINMAGEVRNRFYRIYFQRAPLQNGKIQEIVLGICRITPNFQLAFKLGEVSLIPAEISVLENDALIAVANATLPTEKVTALAMDIPAKAFYKALETP